MFSRAGRRHPVCIAERQDVRYALSVLLAAHGLAHLPGFLVPWRWMQSPELPFKTTVLAGRIDVGVLGIRTVGLAWLATAIVLLVIAAGITLRWRWAEAAAPVAVGFSLVLCVLELPHARLGLVVNLVALLWLAVDPQVGIGVRRWDRMSAIERGRLTMAQATPVGQFSSLPSHELPDNVQRFLARAIVSVEPIGAIDVTQTGRFQMGTTDDSWKPFTATQQFTLSQPGFIWEARIAMAPVVFTLVRDSYIDGEGAMRAEVQGLMRVANLRGGDALASGALQRWLAEAVWFPVALQPSERLTWEAIDDHRARVSLVDRGHRVSLEFTFTSDGDVVRIFSPDRMREVKGQFIPTPWEVICADYGLYLGMRVPTRCEVAWLLPEGRFPFWRGQVTAINPPAHQPSSPPTH